MYFLARLLLVLSFLTGCAGLAVLTVLLAPWSWCFIVLYAFSRLTRRKRSQLTACGSARWAEVDRDLRRGGMLVREE